MHRAAVVIDEGVAGPFGNAASAVEIAYLTKAVLDARRRCGGQLENPRSQQLRGQPAAEDVRLRMIELEIDAACRSLREVQPRVGDVGNASVRVEGDRLAIERIAGEAALRERRRSERRDRVPDLDVIIIDRR